MDLFETLGLGPRQPEENVLYVAIYEDPPEADAAVVVAASGAAAAAANAAASSSFPAAGSYASPSIPMPYTGDAPPSASGLFEAANSLELLRARCTACLLPYITDYVWNKDPLVFRLSSRQASPWERRRGLGLAPGRRRRPATVAAAAARPAAPESTAAAGGDDGGGPRACSGSQGGSEGCVWATMRFGDAVDDEWWVVWLLMRMTRELQNISVQVWDNDGQFLLIEAAYALPRWLKPEIADNRVWLRRGRLHIIPLPSAAAPDLSASPDVTQALAVLREGRLATASQRVQRPIDQRIEGYPDRARREQQHVARCLLPWPVAAALRTEPQLVSELVEAFYLRDADDMRAAARMRFLPPSLERSPALVRMTRCHYAQLAAQRFSAPRGLAMPPPDSPLAKAADLGLKLTVAAEIIAARHATAVLERRQQQQQQQQGGKPEAIAAAPAAAITEARFQAEPAWRRFKASLDANGYFQGNIPGSRRYKELLGAALEVYAAGLGAESDHVGGSSSSSSSVAQASSPEGAALLRNPRRRLAELILDALDDGGCVRASGVEGGPLCNTAEFDDSWLDQHPDRLQAELDLRQAELNKHTNHDGRHSAGREPSGPSGDVLVAAGQAQSQARHAREVDADDIAPKLRSFMEQLSGLEGVEASGIKAGAPGDDDNNDGGGGGRRVDFNPVRFLRELGKVLGPGGPMVRTFGQRVREELDEGTEDGEDASTEEGSSFFSADEDDGDDDEDLDNSDGEGEHGEEEEVGEGGAGRQERMPAIWAAARPGSVAATVAVAPGAPAGGSPSHAQEAQHLQSEAAPRVAGETRSAARVRCRKQVPSAAAVVPAAASTGIPDGPKQQPQTRLALKRGFLSRQKTASCGSGSGGLQPSRKAPGGAVALHGTAGAAAAAAAAATTATAGVCGAEPRAARSSARARARIGLRPGILPSAEAVAAAAAGGIGSGSVDGAGDALWRRRRELDWEVRTATDSDDAEDRGERSDDDTESPGGAEGEPRRQEHRKHFDDQGDEDEDDHAATARLLAALGVGISSSGSGSDGENDEGKQQGHAAAMSRSALQQTRSTVEPKRQRLRRAGAGGAAAAAAAAARAAGEGGGGAARSRRRDDDGDDGDSDAFMPLYDSAMQAELAGTTLARSFDVGSSIPEKGNGSFDGAAGGSGSVGAAAGLWPVDLDMNLVRNLLRSYTAQQGSAGPAGNIAGMLGMSLAAGDVVD